MSKKKIKAPKLTSSEKITQALQLKDFAYLIGVLSKASINGLTKVENLASEIITLYPEKQSAIFTLLLTRIGSLKKPASVELSKKLHADIMFHQAKAIIAAHSEETRPGVKAEHFEQALELFNKANILIQLNDLGLTIDPETAARDLIGAYGKSEIEGSKGQAFSFAKNSLERQQSELPKDHPSVLSALLTTANTGNDLALDVTKPEALNYAKEAYNMALRISDSVSASKALRLEAEIYHFYGDRMLANFLSQQARALNPTEGKHSPEDITKNEKIITHGKVSENIFSIKSKIQAEILNQIQEAAAKGKWVETKRL